MKIQPSKATPALVMKAVSTPPVLFRILIAAAMAMSAATRPAPSASEGGTDQAAQVSSVRVGAGRIFRKLSGKGEPAVVLVSGLGDGLITWAAVQKKVAAFSQVMSYDRPGLGQSDAVVGPRDVPHMVAELHELLREAHLPPPYVMVGHSLGGFIVQYFAVHFPQEVKGMVLVDPALANFYLRGKFSPGVAEGKSEEGASAFRGLTYAAS